MHLCESSSPRIGALARQNPPAFSKNAAHECFPRQYRITVTWSRVVALFTIARQNLGGPAGPCSFTDNPCSYAAIINNQKGNVRAERAWWLYPPLFTFTGRFAISTSTNSLTIIEQIIRPVSYVSYISRPDPILPF